MRELGSNEAPASGLALAPERQETLDHDRRWHLGLL